MHKENKLKKKLDQDQVVIGTWAVIASATVAEILGRSGMDYIIVDAEHGPVGYETAENMIRAVENTDCTPLMRVGENNESLILRALDIGAQGIIIPQIETKEDATRAVSAVKYSPAGKRGLSVLTRAGGYSLDSSLFHTRVSNENTLVVLLVEGKRGMDNLEKILEVEHIDVIYLGLYDLSASLGVPGDIKNKIVTDFIEGFAKTVKAKGIKVGCFVSDIEFGKVLKDLGVTFLAYRADCDILLDNAQRKTNELRNV